MILPGFEAEAELGELREALAELRVARQVRRHDAGGEFADRLAARPRRRHSEYRGSARRATASLGLQHVAHARAECEVGMADDRLGDTARAVGARRTHRGDAVDELDLADRRHLGGAVPAVHRLAFEEDGGDDVVAAADIGQELRQEVAATMRRVPEVVMRVDDRQLRLERRLGRTFRQPCLQLGVVAIGQAWVFAPGVAWLGHFPSPWFTPPGRLGTGDATRQHRWAPRAGLGADQDSMSRMFRRANSWQNAPETSDIIEGSR